MDADEETEKFKWLLGFAAGLLVTTILAWGELTYVAFGKSADAQIVKVENVELPARRGRTVAKTEISYRFTDNTGALRTGSDQMDADWDGPRSGNIPIVYRAGPEGKSRLAGHINWFGLGMWLFFLVPTVWVLSGWIKESVEYGREKKLRAAKEKRPYRY